MRRESVRPARAAGPRSAFRAQRAAGGDARRGDQGRRSRGRDLRIGISRERRHSAARATAGDDGARSRNADLRRQLHGVLQRSRRGLDLRIPEPARAASRCDRVHRPFRQRVRGIRAQRSALRVRADDLAGPGADHHRRRLHRLRARPARGQGDRPLPRNGAGPGRRFVPRSPRLPSVASPSSR